MPRTGKFPDCSSTSLWTRQHEGAGVPNRRFGPRESVSKRPRSGGGGEQWAGAGGPPRTQGANRRIGPRESVSKRPRSGGGGEQWAGAGGPPRTQGANRRIGPRESVSKRPRSAGAGGPLGWRPRSAGGGGPLGWRPPSAGGGVRWGWRALPPGRPLRRPPPKRPWEPPREEAPTRGHHRPVGRIPDPSVSRLTEPEGGRGRRAQYQP